MSAPVGTTMKMPIKVSRVLAVLSSFLLWLGVVTCAYAQDNAAFVSQTVPDTMVSDQSYAVSVTMQNTGSTTWSAANGYYLHSQTPLGNTTWGLSHVVMPNDVAPGQSVTFSFNATAPSTPGAYNFRWRMLRHNVAWFGPLSTNVDVTVSSGVNNAQFVSQTVPGTMVANQSYAVSVTMQNTGNTTWSAANDYYLHSQNPLGNTTWGLSHVVMPNNVAPGQSVTFSFNATAPSTPGVYNFQWRMLRHNVAWFGALTTNATISVEGSQAATMYFIHPDHLNTPRVITNNAGQAVWRWDQADPFGGNIPNENPSGLGAFTCNLRLPGQYFDKESNTHYNYFRDYDPAIGRYIQSDPIGLRGGLNTYSYVALNPLSFTDISGLDNPLLYVMFRNPQAAPSPGSGLGTIPGYSCAVQVLNSTTFAPSASDKYKHCVVSCKIAIQCGSLTSMSAGVGKEIADLFGPGNAEWGDLVADWRGLQCGAKVKWLSKDPCIGFTCERCCSEVIP